MTADLSKRLVNTSDSLLFFLQSKMYSSSISSEDDEAANQRLLEDAKKLFHRDKNVEGRKIQDRNSASKERLKAFKVC